MAATTYPALTRSSTYGRSLAASGDFDGAHWSARPVVPCAQVSTVRPSFGAAPVGATMTPDTAMSRPSTEREWYSTLTTWLPPTSGSAAVRITVPGAASGSGSGGW